MSELSEYRAMLVRAGITFTEKDEERYHTIRWEPAIKDVTCIVVEGGYGGFYCTHVFDRTTGELRRVESFE